MDYDELCKWQYGCTERLLNKIGQSDNIKGSKLTLSGRVAQAIEDRDKTIKKLEDQVRRLKH